MSTTKNRTRKPAGAKSRRGGDPSLQTPARVRRKFRLSAAMASWLTFLALVVLVGGGAFAAVHWGIPYWTKSAPQPAPEVVDTVKGRKPPEGEAPPGMVWVPGGRFQMGASNEKRFADATHLHEVEIDGFWMDKTEVTNEQFAKFVKATKYKTIAEQKPKWEDLKKLVPPGTPKPPDDVLVPGSLVFTPPKRPVPLNNHTIWWRWVPGTSWKEPEGPGSNIKGREKHPVVHVCYDDAVAYAKWAKKRLPTEAEWEYAARGGLDQKRYTWGNELLPKGKWHANIWQGRFPLENKKLDGFVGTAPVASYAPNGYGLYDFSGNVWEWCQDWYRPDYYKKSPKRNPKGPADSHDPLEPRVPKRVQRGGSFLCSDEYCIRYLPGGRGKGEPMSAQSHVGFRCARSAE